MLALARARFFRHPYPVMGLNSASGFGALTNDDKMTTDLLDSIWLALRDRQKPYTALPQNYITGDEMVCLTTTGVVHDLKREVGTGSGGLSFVEVQKYQQGSPLIRGELGMWRGVRFVDNPLAKLWNCGKVEVQAKINYRVKPGDGAPDPKTTKVEFTRLVGQPNATHYIRVDNATGIKAGDMIKIHRLKHTAETLAADGNRGVVGGPVFDDPMAQDVEVHSVDTTTAGAHKILIKEPYMMTDDSGAGLETEIDGDAGIFGYVTLAKTVHTALFLLPGMSNNALVAGVAQPPDFYMPPAYDDYMSIFRVAYDFWLEYALWDARLYEMVFLTGPSSLIGKRNFR